MIYEYPPPGLIDFDFHPLVWTVVISLFWIVSIGLMLSAIAYFSTRLAGDPSTKWMLFAWIVGLLVELVLMGLIGLNQRVDPRLGMTCGLASLVSATCGVASLIHCSIALWTHNARVREVAIDVIGWTYTVCLISFFILIGAAFLLPARFSGVGASTRSQCKNNLKQIGLAFSNWQEIHGRIVDATVQVDDQPPHSWRVELLPYFDQAPLYHRYDQSNAWDSAANIGFSQMELPVLQCPALPDELRLNDSGQYYTAYATVIGTGTLFPHGKALTTNQITDGRSNTVLVVEACGQQIVWSKPQDIEKTPQNVAVNLPGSQPKQSPGIWSSYHRTRQSNGANTLMADGAVRWISKETDPRVLSALLTPAGGETVGEY